MFALIENNQITQVGDPSVIFPNEPKPDALYAIARGAKEVIEGEREDERFYWVTFDKYEITGNTVTRKYISTPKALNDVPAVKEDGTPLMRQVRDPSSSGTDIRMIDTDEQVIVPGLKSQYAAQFKATARSLLADTDWMVIRKAERNVAIPADVAAKRLHIITECERLITACNAAADMPAFIQAVNSANWSGNE